MAFAREDGAIADRPRRDPHGDVLMRAMAVAFARLDTASWRVRRGVNLCPEIDCVRQRLPPGLLVAAENRALEVNVGADEILIAEGHISQDGYCRALAAHLGLRFVNLDGVSRSACPASSEVLLQVPNGALLPLVRDGALIWAVAPRGLGARHLIMQLRSQPDLRDRIVITAPDQIRRFVQRHEGPALAWQAAERLRVVEPLLSAGARGWRARAVVLGALVFLCAALAIAPGPAILFIQVVVSLVFLAWSALRIIALASARVPPDAPEPVAPLADRDLPVYTVIVALYREAAALPELTEALRALDYPPEKLQVLLVLEADDPQTRVKADILRLGPPFEVIFAPSAAPRTKPKALNAALAFARGEMTVIFDAEDKPEPDQLRRAAAAFAADRSGRLACLQARLTIDNTADSWIAGLFTAEYAGLFDVMLPGLAAHELPIPLGGTSNHFRTRVLREVGGWDAYNVTEDADLGIRLARMGHRIGVLGSSTYEEAPSKVRPWLRQRTRWLKGWMQTWGVHMRRPLRLLCEIGPAGFATFQLLFIGTVLAALLQPLAWLLIIVTVLSDRPPATDGHIHVPGLDYVHWGALTAGYAASIALVMAGLARRRLWHLASLMPLMLVHWVLLSVAAWSAVFQLLRDPYRWDKTEHGLGRTSRLRRSHQTPRRDTSHPQALTGSGADRPPLPRGVASG